jgi:DNA polymerase elongation subunit (family B)
MKQQRTLILDIETRPVLAWVWGLKDQNIAVNQIFSDWRVIAWAAKWLGDAPNKVIYMDQRKAKGTDNDKPILEPLWKLLDEADIVITQNGRNFDGPKLNARFMELGMKPPTPYRHLDTYQIAKHAAAFTSNKLEYLTGKLCTKYKKLAHKKFPGMTLWVECLKGNKAAWNEMKTYNIHDVLATEEFYMKIRAWAPASMPDPFFVEDRSRECGRCGGSKMQRRGERVTLKKRIARYQCQDCGTWQDGETIKTLKKAA